MVKIYKTSRNFKFIIKLQRINVKNMELFVRKVLTEAIIKSIIVITEKSQTKILASFVNFNYHRIKVIE